jgi:hypothetical protein
MKTVLKVLRYGDHDFRFETDFDPDSNPDAIIDVIAGASFAMLTTLWGGNENAVIAMIRALTIADLSVCADRKKIIGMLDEASANLAKARLEAQKEIEKRGGKVITFGPGVQPPKTSC